MLIVDTTRRMRRPRVPDSSPTRQVPPETLWLLAFYAFVQDLSQGAKQRPNAAPMNSREKRVRRCIAQIRGHWGHASHCDWRAVITAVSGDGWNLRH